MNFTEQYSRLFQRILPTPFTIAVVLSLLTFVLALFWGDFEQSSVLGRCRELGNYWNEGLWNPSLMVFALQMMLMLVLGHVLALSKFMDKSILKLVSLAHTPASSALMVALSTLILAYFNWGLGLVFGAILARKVAENAVVNQKKINYPLIGAAGYVGLLVWHGGISGSSLVKVAERGHLKSLMQGLDSNLLAAQIPDQIPFSQTVFSSMNLFVIALSLILIPTLFFWLAKKESNNHIPVLQIQKERIDLKHSIQGAERLDHSRLLSLAFGSLILILAVSLAFADERTLEFGFINPNYINLVMLGLALALHRNFSSFSHALEKAIGGASGILIQFPLYFGIMGIMKSSGLVTELSAFFAQHSAANTFPIFTLFSAGIVNVFVPSGGGQWAIQGPILIQTSLDLNIPLSKSILAMAYGDQLTNMMQPFWALPLLGITGLKAKQIVPYTLLAMLLGFCIFLMALLLF